MRQRKHFHELFFRIQKTLQPRDKRNNGEHRIAEAPRHHHTMVKNRSLRPELLVAMWRNGFVFGADTYCVGLNAKLKRRSYLK
jgi:hypothetical protein